MSTLTINDKEHTLKFSVLVDKYLNKHIKRDDAEGKPEREKVSGGIAKVLPLLIEQDIEGLMYVWEAVATLKGEKKVTTDDILLAIENRMEEDGDAATMFKEVLDAIDDSVFSRNELKKFVKNMKLVSEMKSKDEEEAEKMKMMLKRMNEGYKEITGRELFEENQPA